MISPKTYFKNIALCLKYPFLKIYSPINGKFSGYRSTWYDSILPGWKTAFGQRMLDELKESLKKDGMTKYFRFIQVKDKWGSLVLDNNGAIGLYTENTIRKYELMSIGFCDMCGAPARYITSGWVEYLCADCFVERHKSNDLVGDMRKCRLKEEDIPLISVSVGGKLKNIDIKKKYGIDYKKLWDIHPETSRKTTTSKNKKDKKTQDNKPKK